MSELRSEFPYIATKVKVTLMGRCEACRHHVVNHGPTGCIAWGSDLMDCGCRCNSHRAKETER